MRRRTTLNSSNFEGVCKRISISIYFAGRIIARLFLDRDYKYRVSNPNRFVRARVSTRHCQSFSWNWCDGLDHQNNCMQMRRYARTLRTTPREKKEKKKKRHARTRCDPDSARIDAKVPVQIALVFQGDALRPELEGRRGFSGRS